MTRKDDERGLYALRATALGLLLTGLMGDGDQVAAEGERIISAGPKATAGVLGFMVAHAADEYITRHGSTRAAVEAVRAEMQAATRLAEGHHPGQARE